MAAIAEGQADAPPNMNMLSGGPTQTPGVSGMNQRCGLCVPRRSKKWLSMDASWACHR